MAWLARSLSNFNSDDHRTGEDHPPEESGSPRNKGVKEDLSEIKKSFTRQLWGVASFLAPPPQSSVSVDSPPPDDYSSSDSHSLAKGSGEDVVAGLRSDLSEISGRFMASGNKAVTEISRLASSFLPFGAVEEEESEDAGDEWGPSGAVGVTDEVLTFARNISKHPETWLDFPLFTDDEDSDDFDMSDVQQDHALAVERLAPRLAALRIELCPGYMSEGCFWKIYFVLLHSRLNKHDAELLSTPQIVEARGMLQELQNRKKADSVKGEVSTYAHEPTPKWFYNEQNPVSEVESSFRNVSLEKTRNVEVDIESEKLSTVDDSTRYMDKSIIGEEPFIQNKDVSTMQVSNQTFDEDDNDEWIEESAEISGAVNVATTLLDDEDVSFSDLEDDNFVHTSLKA